MIRKFEALERRAEMLGLSAYEVAHRAKITRLRYWRAREGKVKRLSSRTKVLILMQLKLDELEKRRASDMDLFTYPNDPGFKEGGTSKEAADSMRSKAPLLRTRVLAALADAGTYGLTAHECAARLGETVFAVAPRLTELHAKGKVAKTDKHRPNASGRRAVVWRKA